MFLGISSFTYGWNIGVEGSMPDTPMNEIDLINQTIDFGLNCLQIGDNLPVHIFDENRKQRLKDLTQKNNIRLEIGAKKLSPDNLNVYLEIAIFFNAPLLRFIIDDEGYQPESKYIIDILKSYVPEFRKNNITLGIENHDRFKAGELAKIMDAVADDSVGICLDCVNSIGAGEGLKYVAEILIPYTVNLHIKDFKARRLPHKMGFIIDGEITGKGMTNVPFLLDKIRQTGRCQSAILEQWVPPETRLENTITKEKLWAEQGIKYVKSVWNIV